MKLSDLYYYVFGDRAIIVPNKHFETKEARENHIHLQEERIRQLFSFLEADKTLHTKFLNLLTALNTPSTNALKQILYGSTQSELSEKQLEMLKEEYNESNIVMMFSELNDQFSYFIPDEIIDDNFFAFFKACKVFEEYLEPSHYGGNEQVANLAYKMLVVFGAAKGVNIFSNIDGFLKEHTKKGSDISLHDALLHSIPENHPPLDVEGWQAFVKKFGPKGLEYFQEATGIEGKLEGRAPKTKEEAEKAASQLTYLRAKEYPALARLCKKYHLPEETFNKCLEVEKRRKTKDVLPDVMVDGKEISPDFAGYHLVKLPIDDPRAYVLGHITNCCQSMGGDSEQCVIDGITREKNGFYVLLKGKPNTAPHIEGKINDTDFEIVGQGYAWLSRRGNLTFDSWENLRPETDDKVVVPLLKKFAEKASNANENLFRVTIGRGGKTPKDQFLEYIGTPESIAEGYLYGDSENQYLLFLNEGSLDKAEEKLAKKLASQQNAIWINEDQFLEFVRRFTPGIKVTEWVHELFLNDDLSSFWKKNHYLRWIFSYDRRISIYDKDLEALHLLYEKQLLKEKYVTAIRDFKNFSDVLLNMPLKLLNDANLSLLAARAEMADVLAKWMQRIFVLNPDIASNENFSLLAATPKYKAMKIVKMLEDLYAVNPALVTDENFKLIAEHASEAERISEAILGLVGFNSRMVNQNSLQFLITNIGVKLSDRYDCEIERKLMMICYPVNSDYSYKFFEKSLEPTDLVTKFIRYLVGDSSVRFSEQEIKELGTFKATADFKFDSLPKAEEEPSLKEEEGQKKSP